MKELESLFYTLTSEKIKSINELSESGSNRKYYRIQSENCFVIGVKGTSLEENNAFFYMANHFYEMGLPVPKVLAKSTDGFYYLQEDLGNTLLFDYIKEGRQKGILNDSEKEMIRRTLKLLPEVQIKGAENFDFSNCYPQPEFNQRSILWDLNYFKYCFLKATGIDFQENELEDDFIELADILLNVKEKGFMYRDFQSRNVMIKDNQPYFIDFQGGRKGPVHYDVASFLWQAKANFPNELRVELLETYIDKLNTLIPINKDSFKSELKHFVLFRTLQVLGAYGFRGYFEKKAHFIESIPFAIENLRQMLKKEITEYPYLAKILQQMTELEQFQMEEKKPKENLTVTVTSFSYKKGIPEDKSGNGGGFVFDCRAIHNPGRYAEYKELTGLDKPVIEFLEKDGEITEFLQHVNSIIDPVIKRYLERGFTSLSINFGCTGGQHRSVYSAQKTAEYIHNNYRVEVDLIHREQHKELKFEPK